MAPPRETERGWVCVGALAGAHGVKGEAVVKAFTEDPEMLGRFDALHLGPGGQPLRLSLTRPVKGGWAARLQGVASREDAQALAGTELYVPRAAVETLNPAGEDEYFLADLIGLTVVDAKGARLGAVRAVPDYGAGALVELALDAPVPGLGKSVLLPFETDFVPDIDLAGGRMQVNLPAWLEAQGQTETT